MMASIGVLILTIVMVKASYSRDHYKAISLLNQENLVIQQNYYTMMSEKNEDIRKFRHDIKNHLFCIHTLAKTGNQEELVRYIENLTEEMKDFSYRLHTGSNIVDAIINDAMNKHPDITFSSEGYLPNPLHIKAVDLCTIVSNVINNAVEAVSKINEPGDRKVAVTFKNHDHMIFMKATNTIAEPVAIVNNSIATSKVNKELHGFGIENIKNSIKKYGGNIALNSMENEFIVEIILKNNSSDRSPQKSDR
jgi:sensor histidine kinase regulating citrate/malate metabolism